ncbi:beta-ketoacyl-[acyl-carrier-protein] synthase family protein [Streptomyces cyaneus]|uniref:beta-ketoacyl-[acyl-carrier-protein] synthase family protein n=1 Tax=Streptomyces cyaneus TaxID=1904 RepID=UPI000FF8767C|nr:beta-ketoacyl-[acyl-carrier-protein] synthase family protein [Streptomyces cyaneus]
MSDNDIVVTGLGATTPLGGDVWSTWNEMLAGRSGVRRLDAEFVEKYRLPVRIGAPLAVDPATALPRGVARRLDRCAQAAVVAAEQAWEDAKAGDRVDPDRVGVVVGTGIGGVRTLLEQAELLARDGLRQMSPLTVPMLMPNGPAAHVGLAIGARAGVHAPVSACASGAEALAWAWRMLRTNEADIVVAGGAEASLTGVTMAAFARARTLSLRNDDPERASRPWDVDRDGFVLGEGAGILVLERAEHARARGAKAYARLAGVGTSADAHHITAPDPTGRGQARAIGAAVRSAGLLPKDVGHVNAHATSTVVGDIPETVAIRSALGDHPVLTGPKGALGHLLGAAGAVEAIATVLTLRHGIVPPTANLERLDPEVRLDVVAGRPRQLDTAAAVTDSFGFGGHNIALTFTTA